MTAREACSLVVDLTHDLAAARAELATARAAGRSYRLLAQAALGHIHRQARLVESGRAMNIALRDQMRELMGVARRAA